MEKKGGKRENILLVVGTGKHRDHQTEDFIKLVGKKIHQNYKIISHQGDNKGSHIYLGRTAKNTPLYIERNFVQADIKIITGMIDPHQFVGFTGGLKAVTIGLGYKETIEKNHSQMFNKNATLGSKTGNPVRDDLDQVRKFIKIDYALNVILNEKNKIIKVLAGSDRKVWEELEAHKAYLFALSIVRARVILVSEKIPVELAPQLKIEIVNTFDKALNMVLNQQQYPLKIAILPKGSSIIPAHV